MGVVAFDEATHIVLEQAARLPAMGRELIGLLNAVSRVLAEPVTADRDQPPFARSTRDGFAVRADEFTGGQTLRVIGLLKAGARWKGEVGAGEAVQIMTGAPLPAGSNAVAMIEFVERTGDRVCGVAGRGLSVGENIVPRGSEARAGTIVLGVGTALGAAEVALAAASGCPELAVFNRPKVAIVATGDELVELGHGLLAEEQIWNSNSYALAAMVAACGAEPVRMPIARDVREQVSRRIAEGRAFDLLILSGGVSMGEYDLVEEALAGAGAEFFFTGVRMQPGKPVVFGRLPPCNDTKQCFFFGLPGNPVSTQVTFHCFVAPFLRAMTGAPAEGPLFVQAALAEEVAAKPDLMRLLPGRLSHNGNLPEVSLVAWQGSGDLAANGRANCYAVFPPRQQSFRTGEVISILLR